MTTQVTFSIKKSKGLTPLVILKQFKGDDSTELHFVDDADEVRTLNTGATYIVKWDVVGNKKDEITVAWKSDDGRDGILIDDFKIDPNHADARPWPGGDLWVDHGVSGLVL